MTQKKIALTHIAHVYYKHKNIDAALQFLRDFGFTETKRDGKVTYFRGYGKEPFVVAVEASDETAFGGAAFAVESAEDLELASKTLPKEVKATAVHDITGAPGGREARYFL